VRVDEEELLQCALQQVLFGEAYREELDGRGMWHVQERGEVYIEARRALGIPKRGVNVYWIDLAQDKESGGLF